MPSAAANMPERLNEEIRQAHRWCESSPRTRIVGGLVRALTIEDHPYLSMELLKEHKIEALRQTA